METTTETKRKVPTCDLKVLSSPEHTYTVEKHLGHGCFGTVLKCKKLPACETVAVKVVPDQHLGKREADMLKKIKVLDMDKNNLLKFFEPFKDDTSFYFVFELLDISISKFLSNRNKKPLCVSEIRPVAQQMLVALGALKSIGVVHTDIKPDNIMLVNHKLHPFKVKLIDFGLARDKSTLTAGKVIQPIGYRAPEVILGLPMDEGVDMWSLGCVLACMYLGRHLYPTHCQYELMKAIDQMQGPLPEDLLRKAPLAKNFYTFPKHSSETTVRLNTPKEYMQATGKYTVQRNSVYQICPTLYDLPSLRTRQKKSFDVEDTTKFISLLRRMLSPETAKRLTPEVGLSHDFITMVHLLGRRKHQYALKAYKYVAQATTELLPSGKSATSSIEQEGNSPTETGRGTDKTPDKSIDKSTAKSTAKSTYSIFGSIVGENERMFSLSLRNPAHFVVKSIMNAAYSLDRSFMFDSDSSSQDTVQRSIDSTVSGENGQEKLQISNVKLPGEEANASHEVGKPRRRFLKRVENFFSRNFTVLCFRSSMAEAKPVTGKTKAKSQI